MKTPLSFRVSLASILGRLRSDFQLSILCILAAFVSVSVSPFMIYRLIAGEIIIFAIDLVMISITVGIAIYAWFSHQVEQAAMGLATSITVALVATAFYNSASAPFWLYCNVVFAYALVPTRQATVLATLGFVATAFQPDAFASTMNHAAFLVTLPVTALFAFIYVKRHEVQREQMARLALTDVLTGVGNRRAFNEEFAVALSAANRRQGHPTIVLFDVDHFKTVNDDYGHGVGDEVLKKMVALVKDETRPNDRLFRVGGEEFCLIVDQQTLEQTSKNMDRLRLDIQNYPFIANHTVTVSMGITRILPGDTLEATLKRGDRALYVAKRNGRNQLVCDPTCE